MRNLTMMTDFYEFTMSNTFLADNKKDTTVCFDMFFRKNPDKAGFAIVAGLEQVIQYIKGLNFTEENIILACDLILLGLTEPPY